MNTEEKTECFQFVADHRLLSLPSHGAHDRRARILCAGLVLRLFANEHYLLVLHKSAPAQTEVQRHQSSRVVEGQKPSTLVIFADIFFIQLRML